MHQPHLPVGGFPGASEAGGAEQAPDGPSRARPWSPALPPAAASVTLSEPISPPLRPQFPGLEDELDLV